MENIHQFVIEGVIIYMNDYGNLIIYKDKDGKNYNTKYYNLDMIVAIGFIYRSERLSY